MNRTQIILLGVAAAAAIGAFLLWRAEPVTRVIRQVQTEPMEQVLVAARDLGYSVRIDDSSTKWAEWPKRNVPPGAITQSAEPGVKAEIDGSYVRQPLTTGELIRKDRFIKGNVPGMMASLVAPGRRALGVEASLAGTAGGFVLPDDRVDVFGVFRSSDGDPASGGVVSRLVVGDVRVLAVGGSTEKKPAEAQRAASTVTLELTPTQTRCVLEAQKTGPLSLVIRPIVDALPADGTDEAAMSGATECGASTGADMVIIRRGVAANLHAK
jgi:pilus assembly protein CpaB